MHILLTTYGLLVIFALFCLAQWRSSVDLSYIDAAAQENFASCRKEVLDLVSDNSKATFRQLAPSDDDEEEDEETDEEEPIVKPDSFHESEDEPKKQGRRTSFLHINILFSGEEEANIFEGQGKACFTLLKALITELYSGQVFFERAKQEIPDLEERFILNLMEKVKDLQEEKSLSNAKELASLNLDDYLQSYIRYKMFTGNKYRKKKATHEEPGYYPLIEFVSMRKHSHLMSLWLAPKPLLMALFQNEDVVKDIILARREIYNELDKDKNKSAVKTKGDELKRRFSIYVRGIDTQFIDFNVSRSRPQD